MKPSFRSSLILSAVAIAIVSSSTALAGPGADYWTRRSSAREAAKVESPTSKCKITEVIRLVPGPRGVVRREVVSTSMDCSKCNDASMVCCAGKVKS